MQILSWNINGLRAVIKKGFTDFLKKEKPDVLCLQEIKIDRRAIEKENFDFPGYAAHYHPAERKGYSGTAALFRDMISNNPLKPVSWDDEGRIQAFELDKYYLVNVYFPNAGPELRRMDFKLDFNDRLLKYVKKLEKKKPVVVCGDFNVAHEEIDLARPKDNVKNAGFTPKEREWMSKFLSKGFVDTYRRLHPDKVEYSWWTYRFGARERNVGWRIDYFCVSKKIFAHIQDSFILTEIQGSDHAPVGIKIK